MIKDKWINIDKIKKFENAVINFSNIENKLVTFYEDTEI